jgi:hypothetical protein
MNAVMSCAAAGGGVVVEVRCALQDSRGPSSRGEGEEAVALTAERVHPASQPHLYKVQHTTDLRLNLIRQAENVSIILREAAHPEKPMHCTTALIAAGGRRQGDGSSMAWASWGAVGMIVCMCYYLCY